ncbi:plexin-A2-like isoform X2 [Pomacea canaliculata]|uniref:plexin-A2-like isoform X2 n=1 Tax=Pomacea canaliculata TaxID=400727 RepID=UPI000D736C66|nr:plexin-A2-like isoform X2 [Pomacea canaliculata]
MTTTMPLIGERVVSLLLFVHLNMALETLITFRDPGGNPFQQLIVHSVTGTVYAGATNRLHRLTPTLTLLQSAAIGPREDNPNCPPPLLPCLEEKTLHDSVTKGLAIDYEDNTVLLCSTLYHGLCQKLDLSNITHVVKLIHMPLVPNEKDSSCVLFVGPSMNGEKALYVGAEYSNLGNKNYRDLVYSISSRQLSDLNLIFRDQDGNSKKVMGTKKVIKDEFKASFPVKYIYGFIRGMFAYFVTVQKESPTSDKMVSRISRVCTQDRFFYSHIQLPLLCDASSVARYDIIHGAVLHPKENKLFTIFSDSTADTWNEGQQASVLCVLDLNQVDAEFNRSVEECYNGNGRVGPQHFETVRTCVKTTAPVDMCAQNPEAEAYPSIEGSRPVLAVAVWTLVGQLGTALTVQSSGQLDLAFIGTTDGDLLKVVVQGTSGRDVDRLRVDSQGPVLQVVDSTDMDNLYVLTPSKVSLVWARHCEHRSSCEECVADSDPMCGWCIMQNRCTAEVQCDRSAITPNWLPAATATCAAMTNIQPQAVSFESLQSDIQSTKQISFELDHVSVKPEKDTKLGCMFVAGQSEHHTPATLKDHVITCPLPDHTRLPRIPQDHEDMVLHFHVQGKSVVTRSVSVYDCRSNTDCSSCTNSSYQCQWCYASGICLRQGNACPANKEYSVTPITSPSACPLIWTFLKDKDILVHAGESRQIAVQVRNLESSRTKEVKCHFSYLDSNFSVAGAISSQSLTCSPVRFDYADKMQLPYVTANFKVTWGPSALPLDNSQNIQVRIYKCPLMVTNCGKCLSMDAEYECGWCGDRCTLQKYCPPSLSWMDRTATCPGPQILRFSPTTGPVKGRTSMSVTGLNLGKTYADIAGGITVAGVNCEVKPDHYEPSSGFVCETEMTDKAVNGTITVVVNNQYKAESDSPFSFVDPELVDITPKVGPRSGGTTICIKGEDMDAGSDVTVMIDGGLCQVLKRNRTVVECVTPKQTGTESNVTVEVNFGGSKKSAPQKFTYAADPVIFRIEPMKSILSGGTLIRVMGKELNLIQNPKFFVTYGGKFFTSKCVAPEPYGLECEVPEMLNTVTAAGANVTETSPLEVHYGFSLDGVTTFRNISHQPTFPPLLLYPDPDIIPFSEQEQTKQHRDKNHLVVKGQFRIINNLMASVFVYVGKEPCLNVAATDTVITCEPPSKAPDGTDLSGKAQVQVRIGNLVRTVGFLRYYEASGADKPMALGVILGVVLPILAIIILLTVCVLRRHRKHKPATDYIPDVLQDYQGQKEEEEIGLNHVAVTADMNGQLCDERDSGPYIADLLGRFDDTALRHSITTMLIPRSKLDMGELIGKGHFGAVYKAQLQRGDDKSSQVAVKTLQAKVSEVEAIQNFLQETALLKDLQHPHLLPVVGVCITASDDPMVVSPFMATEDLKSYIREPSKMLTVADLVGLASQIADGMAYLQEVKVVHRNLAARNCIVTEERCVRLTDYGVTGTLFPQQHYVSEDGCAQGLLRWMAPESVINFQFSSKSDIWSFGIVLWELFTRGITPYPDVDNAGILAHVTEGKRMKKPKQSPEAVYGMMLACWSQAPEDRPDFSQLLQQLQLLISPKENEDDPSCQLLNNSVDISGSTEYLEVIG